MGAWAYCGCGRSFDVPTTQEIVEGKQECSCGESLAVDRYLKDQLLVEMHEEVATLKKQVRVLIRAVKVMSKKT